MATQDILPDREQVRTAVEQARRNAAGDVRWTRAINKAWDRLQLRGWLWNGSTLRILSSDGMCTYTVTANRCECRAFTEFRKPCLHRAMRKIIVNATVAADFTSRVEQAVRVSPAERAVAAWHEQVMDADMDAIADDLYGRA